MKKKVLCLFLGIWLCLSFALPLYALDGTIDADDDATLVTPTLEITDSPIGAAAIAHDLTTNQTYYYSRDGYNLSSNEEDFYEPGWMPESHCVDAVIGDDNRELVSNTEIAPFSAIAWIQATYPSGAAKHSTAALISPNVALTAAHCIYQPTLGGWPISIEFFPAISGPYNSAHLPFYSTTAKEVVISLPYFENGNGAQWDWGVIRLNSNIGYDCGFLGFQYLNTIAMDLPVMISGYPEDLNNEWATINQYRDSNLIYYDETSRTVISNFEVYKTRYFSYTVDTIGGQSGSPILYSYDGTYRIIGIHAQAGEPTGNETYYNEGFGITDEVFRFLSTYKNYYYS